MTEPDLLTHLRLALAELPDDVQDRVLLKIVEVIERYESTLPQCLADVAAKERRALVREVGA